MMKKLIMILSILLLLTGCGRDKTISGEVVSVTNEGQHVRLTVRTEKEKEIPVLVGENALVYSFSGVVPHEQLLTGELIRPIVTAYDLCRADGAWLADRVCVESIQLPEGYTLSDGTELTVRRDYIYTTYMTADGVELLREEEPVGPDNVSVGGLPSLADLSGEAQQAIMAHYAELGLLYDLDEEIEKAYREYLAAEDKSAFQSCLLSQHISPSACSGKLIWYSAYVTRPVGSGLHQQTSSHTVFDRKTGARIDTASLFLCSEAEAARVILDASGMPDTQLKREMEKAFRFDYLNFHSGALDVCFPAGSLSSQNTDHILGIDYEALTDILHPWAVPDAIE